MLNEQQTQPTYRLPPKRQNRIIRDSSWKQWAFLGTFLVVAFALGKYTHSPWVFLAILPIAIVGAVGFPNGPGYRYPKLWWDKLHNKVTAGKAYGGAGSKLVIGLEPTDYGPFGTNWFEKDDSDIVYWDLGGWKYCDADPEERQLGDQLFFDGLKEGLLQTSDRLTFGFITGARPSTVKGWRKEVWDWLAHDKFRRARNAHTEGIEGNTYQNDLDLFKKLFEAQNDDEVTIDPQQLLAARARDLDNMFDDHSDKGVKYYRLFFVKVRRSDELKGVNEDTSRFDPDRFDSSILVRICNELTAGFQFAGYESAHILSYDEVCELDYLAWNIYTELETELATTTTPSSQQEPTVHPIWPTKPMTTLNNQLNSEGGSQAIFNTTRFKKEFVTPGEFDGLASTGIQWHLATLTATEASVERDRFVKRRSDGAQKGLFGNYFNQTNPDELEYQMAEARRSEEIDELFLSQLGIRFTRRDMVGSTDPDDLERKVVPSLEALHRSHRIKAVRMPSAMLISEFQHMLGA